MQTHNAHSHSHSHSYKYTKRDNNNLLRVHSRNWSLFCAIAILSLYVLAVQICWLNHSPNVWIKFEYFHFKNYVFCPTDFDFGVFWCKTEKLVHLSITATISKEQIFRSIETLSPMFGVCNSSVQCCFETWSPTHTNIHTWLCSIPGSDLIKSSISVSPEQQIHQIFALEARTMVKSMAQTHTQTQRTRFA